MDLRVPMSWASEGYGILDLPRGCQSNHLSYLLEGDVLGRLLRFQSHIEERWLSYHCRSQVSFPDLLALSN